MTLEQYAQISQYAIASATGILALAFLAHMAEWGFARRVDPTEVATADVQVTPDGEPVDAPSTPAAPPERPVLSETMASIGLSLSTLATVVLTLGVAARGIAAQRVPWGNMYEFGVTGVTVALLVYLVLVRLSDVRWLGGIVAGFGLIVLGMSLSTYVPAGPLVPALDSYWLVIHVAAMMISGGLFLLGAAASVLFIIRSRAERLDKVGPVLARFPSSPVIDQIAYRVNAVSFPIWTFGALIAGPIWAHYAWGRYWGWDPKEVWALITWIVYAGYLHARVTAGWRGKRAAVIALVGFTTFLFSFYGINLFGSGLHSYAK